MLPALRHNRRVWLPTRWLDREFDRLFDGFPGDVEPATPGAYPADIWEDDDNVYVEAEMPGFERDEINVTLEDGILNIAAERKNEEEKGTRHLTERRYTQVRRSFSLPTAVDDAKVGAKLENGLLHLTLPKRAEVKPRRIKIA